MFQAFEADTDLGTWLYLSYCLFGVIVDSSRGNSGFVWLVSLFLQTECTSL